MMKKFTVLVLFLGMWGVANAQGSYNDALKDVKDEQESFRSFLGEQNLDENIKAVLDQFSREGVNRSLVTIRRARLRNDDKTTAVKTVAYFIKDLRKQLEQGRINVYRIPDLLGRQ